MTDAAALSAFWANPIFWQSVLLAFAVLLFGLVALMVRVARLNRNIKALALRLTSFGKPARPIGAFTAKNGSTSKNRFCA